MLKERTILRAGDVFMAKIERSMTNSNTSSEYVVDEESDHETQIITVFFKCLKQSSLYGEDYFTNIGTLFVRHLSHVTFFARMSPEGKT